MGNDPIRIGVVGCGHWGPNHVRNFSELPEARVVACADPDPKRLAAVTRRFPHVRGTADAAGLVASPDVDAVVIASPTSTHHGLAKAALQAGKHVLCEKPLCSRAAEAEELVGLAARANRTLMVGHVFLFNPGVRKAKECVDAGLCGRVLYMHFTRTNLGPIRQDADVILDLATHDIAIAGWILGAAPRRVSATSGVYLQPGISDVAFLSLDYPNGVLANLHVSWLDPKKVRQMTIVGDKKMVTWDDLRPGGPVEIFDRRVDREPRFYRDYGEFQLLVREGDIQVPRVEGKEPLLVQAEEFLKAARGGEAPLSDGRFGAQVLRVVEAGHRSLAEGGRWVEVQGTV